MKVTIIYDNRVWKKGLEADWGFSCLVEAHFQKILFDTGNHGRILMENMHKLGISPDSINSVFISHCHYDHAGGLPDFLDAKNCKVYMPFSCPEIPHEVELIKIKGPIKIHNNIFSTGELRGIEQSLIIKTGQYVVVIAGCSHPGVREILEAAASHGNVKALIGGLHGFKEFELLEGMDMVCPTHCTQFIDEIKSLYPEKYIEGGAGRVIELPDA